MSIEKLELTDVEWQASFKWWRILYSKKRGNRETGTSIHNNEKRKGVYHCSDGTATV